MYRELGGAEGSKAKLWFQVTLTRFPGLEDFMEVKEHRVGLTDRRLFSPNPRIRMLAQEWKSRS
jgi:hypothetical protein